MVQVDQPQLKAWTKDFETLKILLLSDILHFDYITEVEGYKPDFHTKYFF